MKTIKKTRKTQPAANGLYDRTCEIREYPGGFQELCPTYTMHRENFQKFVLELDHLADRAKTVFQYCSRELGTSKGSKINYKFTFGLGYNNQGRLNWKELKYNLDPKTQEKRLKLITDYEGLRKRYYDFFNLVAIQQGRQEYFNLEFYPAAGKEQTLFAKFKRTYLRLAGIIRLNTTGPKGGTRVIPDPLLHLADEMRCKGKGTKKGSIDTITKVIMNKMGLSTAERTAEAYERDRERIRKTIVRHFSCSE